MVPSSIALADGSVAHLSAGAHVDVDHQGPEFVRLLQGSGSVRYEVSPDPARRFEIDVRGIEVRVIGTVFTIAVTHASVVVSVERGHVEVDSGDGVSELGPGDVLQVELEHDTAREEDAEATPPEPAAATPARLPATPPQTPDALLQRADAARADGRLADAAAALRTLVRQYRDDPRVYSAYFQLGKVERSRGRHRTAASAFAACVRRAPHGALAEDARAEAAISWRDAGESRRARSTAQAYLQHYPKGAHAARMHRMLARIP
jgi:transmembrane sensor